MLDVFVSRWVNGKFTKPINLGSPINSRYDDFSLRYYDDKNGFFTSNRDRDNDDIYSFEQTGEIFGREYINQFEVRDKDAMEYVPNASVKLIFGEEMVYQNTLDSIAQFNINLVAGTYKVIADAPGFDELGQDVEVTEETNQKHIIYLTKNNEVTDAISNRSEASKAVINELLKDTITPNIFAEGNKLYFDMAPIYFDFDQWEIREDSKKVLNELAYKLAKYPTLSIRINSHTDTRGTDMYNQVLSEKRAQSTRDYIAKVGNIDLDRLSFKGYGESKPITNCGDFCTEAQHQQNRRSEFEIVEY
jgi:outer membrane protein OmpA-like peptidoglycan-associated protein